MSKASDGQRSRWQKYHAMERAQEKERRESFRNFVDRSGQRSQLIAWHNDSADRLLLLGEIWDERLEMPRKAASIEEEQASAMLFVRALRTRGVNVLGLTLRDLLRNLFDAWYRERCPLLNPATSEFSSEWARQPFTDLPRFEDRWEFLNPVEQYDVPLFPTATTTK